MRLTPFVAALGALSSGHLCFAQTNVEVMTRIVDEGKNHSQVMKLLRELTNIGARLTSSTNLEKAEAWAVRKFKSWGLSNVHLEKWGEFQVGFDRGKSSGRMTAPVRREFEFTTPSWSEGTHGDAWGQATYAPETMEQFQAVKATLRGKWLVMRRGKFPSTYVPAGKTPTPEQKRKKDLFEAMNSSGILGFVIGWDSDLLQAQGNIFWEMAYENRPSDVTISVRKSDYDAVARELDADHRVELEFNLDQKWRKGPIPCYNVVADIPGSEKPGEQVIVGGHLDSWDPVGSQGAQDNGTGACDAMEAARILMAVKAKPKRTIRFVLWTGEEEGLLGSRGYVEAHAAELPGISAVLVDDLGTNFQSGYVGIAAQKPWLEAAYAPVVAAFPNMPEQFEVRPHMENNGVSDHYGFLRAGVPAFLVSKSGRSDYGYVHHTQHDRFDMAIPEYLVQCSVNHAVVSYYLGCAPTLLPRDHNATADQP